MQVGRAARQLPALRELVLSETVLCRPFANFGLADTSPFSSLRVLVLNGCRLGLSASSSGGGGGGGGGGWVDTMDRLALALPVLEELYLSCNHLSSFSSCVIGSQETLHGGASIFNSHAPMPVRGFSRLTVLDLSNNSGLQWGEVLNLVVIIAYILCMVL